MARKRDEEAAKADDRHTHDGNCWVESYGCRACGIGILCDVCHDHDEPRGECSECEPCVACKNAEASATPSAASGWGAAAGYFLGVEQCPCCEESDACLDGCTFADDCPAEHERMVAARAALRAISALESAGRGLAEAAKNMTERGGLLKHIDRIEGDYVAVPCPEVVDALRAALSAYDAAAGKTEERDDMV